MTDLGGASGLERVLHEPLVVGLRGTEVVTTRSWRGGVARAPRLLHVASTLRRRAPLRVAELVTARHLERAEQAVS